MGKTPSPTVEILNSAPVILNIFTYMCTYYTSLIICEANIISTKPSFAHLMSQAFIYLNKYTILATVFGTSIGIFREGEYLGWGKVTYFEEFSWLSRVNISR